MLITPVNRRVKMMRHIFTSCKVMLSAGLSAAGFWQG
jgi:hypothetical protein